MKVEISEYEKKYSFDLLPITQLVGQNIKKKTYILESLRRYFSTYKYREEENKWRDNLTIEGDLVGRKYFTVLSVSTISEIIAMIKWSKQSLMLEYIKQLTQKFDWQIHLRNISEELEIMFQMMNEDISRLGKIELNYAMSDVWEMVQKSEIMGNNQIPLEDKENDELLMIFLNLIEEVITINPKKMIVLVENIDHLISREDYLRILKKMQTISRNNDLYFVVTTSLEGYVSCTEELCSGIKIYNEVDFQMPELEKVVEYVNSNYPCHKSLSKDKVEEILEKIIQKIGQKNYLDSIEEKVVCKLINQSLMLDEKLVGKDNLLEMAFLKGE